MINSKVILVVDDNPINRLLPGLILRPFGWRVYELSNGLDVLSTLRETGASYILLDIAMPNMDGFGVLACLKKSHVKNVKVIAYTSYLQSDELPRNSS